MKPSNVTSVLLLLCGAMAGAGCGRFVVARLPTEMPQVMPQVCTSEGWCWTHPLPTSDRFVRAFWVGADDLWLVGASGTIVRRTGGGWSSIPSPANALSAIWASGSDDVWVGGSSGPFHWDGKSWSQPPPPTSPSARAVNAIWGCAPDDVWAVGPVATHWDGQQWSYVPADMPVGEGGFRAIWGSGCDDVWAGVLDDFLGSGRMVRWNGSAWLTMTNQPAEQIAGTGADDVWSLAQGQLFRWNGLGAGALQDSRTLNLFPVGAAAVGTIDDGHVISLLARNSATSLPVPAPDAVSGVWGRSANDIWGFGDRGVATHWEGAAWTAQLPGWALGGEDAVKVTGSGPTDLWAVVGSTLLHGDGVTWRTALTAQEVGEHIFDVWARAPNDVWVLGGDARIHRWNGAAWGTEDPPPRGATTPEMRAISGTGPDDVWILRGRNSVLHWDGHSWISRQPYIDNLVDIWAAGPNEVWVVGDAVSHWLGTAWSLPRIPAAIGSAPFSAVGGSGPTDVWVLAGGYAMKVSDDYQDLTVALSTSWRATALSPAGGGGVWVLFQDGATASRLYRLTGTDPSQIPPALIAPAGLSDLWADADGTLWGAGNGGALIRRRPVP